MTTGDEALEVERATRALAEANEELMKHPGVVGTMVGLLRNDEGATTAEIGIVVLVDPDSIAPGAAEPMEALPEAIAGYRVQSRITAVGPEG